MRRRIRRRSGTFMSPTAWSMRARAARSSARTDGCRLHGTFHVRTRRASHMNPKRLREYLPLVGAAYSKLRKLREDHQELGRQLNETARQRSDLARERNELARERIDLARQCQDLARQCQVLIRQNDGYRAHLQISPGGQFLFEAQSESTRLRFIELLRLMRPFDIADRPKIRVGNPHDGGYVMIDDFEGARAALSIGIGDEISWDM